MNGVRRVVGILLAVALLAGVAALSRLPYATHDAERALLRLSWRARGERIERCRRATPEELANVPTHMRRDVVCEGVQVAPYRLRVLVDGRTLADGLVAGSGIAGDRPIYLLREFELQPGPRHLQVAFEKQSKGGDDPDAARPDSSARAHERDARRGTVPPRLTLDTSFTVLRGSVVLVTYDSEARKLALLGGR